MLGWAWVACLIFEVECETVSDLHDGGIDVVCCRIHEEVSKCLVRIVSLPVLFSEGLIK